MSDGGFSICRSLRLLSGEPHMIHRDKVILVLRRRVFRIISLTQSNPQIGTSVLTAIRGAILTVAENVNVVYKKEFLFTDFHERKVRVALYRGLTTVDDNERVLFFKLWRFSDVRAKWL